jgi:protein-disulfide isomerase
MMKLTLIAVTLVLAAAAARADVNVVDNGKTLTVDCAKDKNVVITANKVTLTLTGTCARVMITGNDATVKGSANQVYIPGNNNKVELDAIDELMIAGNKNTVSYRKGIKNKSPKVANPGNDNKVSQTK